MKTKVLSWRSQWCLQKLRIGASAGFLAWCIVMLGLGLSVTSCSDDDDDDKKSEEQKQEEAAKANEAANLFWSVVSQLTNGDAITDDYKNQTFEPTIGQADEGNPLVRIVGTNNMATAVKRFNDLTGARISESTINFEWKNDAVGTLTWRKVNDGRDYATVDVDIKQMPKLQRIVYRDGDQMGTNGKFEGRAYYRFGDVVQDNSGHYWICVRPAFGPESKQDSHWVCVDKLDDKNIEKCSKGGKTWYVPKKLGENTEQMKNFAEMLYAMFDPVMWYSHVDQADASDNEPYFHDFKHKNLQYHSIGFWKEVLRNWENKNLFELVMGVKEDVVRKAVVEDNELRLMCWGHSWWTWTSWNLTLKQYVYSGEAMRAEKEMSKEVNMEGKDAFDLRGEYWKQWEALSQFFGDGDKNTPRWIIRHAKGKDLTKNYNEQEKLKDCKDIYTFYTDHSNLKNMPPEFTITEGTGELGEVIGQNGKFYGTALDAKLAGVKPLGIVIYRGEAGSLNTQWSQQACGLIMSLEDIGGQKYWAREDYTNVIQGAGITLIDDLSEIYKDPYKSKDREGYQMNTVLAKWSKEKATKGVLHAIDVVFEDTSRVVNSNKVSKWYLPSMGEMAMAFHYIASNPGKVDPLFANLSLNDFYKATPSQYYTEDFYDLLSELFSNAYVTQLYDVRYNSYKVPEESYWTATQTSDNNEAWVLTIGRTGSIFSIRSKRNAEQMRPVCAFRVQ